MAIEAVKRIDREIYETISASATNQHVYHSLRLTPVSDGHHPSLSLNRLNSAMENIFDVSFGSDGRWI